VLVVIMNGLAFVLATGVPIFGYLAGLTAALFASWYTYGKRPKGMAFRNTRVVLTSLLRHLRLVLAA